MVVACFPIARQLSLSVIGGATLFIFVAFCAALTTATGSVDALSQDYVLISLLAAATFAATCAVDTSAVEFANPVRAGFVYGLRAALVVALIATPLFYAYAVVEHRTGVVLAFAQVSFALVPLSMICAGMVQRPLLALKCFRRRIAIIGDPTFRDRVCELSGQVLASVEVVGLFDLGGNDWNEAASEGRQACDPSARLQKFLGRTDPDEVVVASLDWRAGGAAAGGLPIRELLEVKARGIRVVEFSEFWERATGQVDLVSMRPSWLLFGRDFYIAGRNRVTKRVFDVLMGSVMLVMTLPLFIIITIILMVTSHGSVLYKQERVGWRGLKFTLLKFRSMYVDAERASGPTWASNRDPRITPFGSFLRSTRLDELPQLWNIIKGDMSVVGPRPERAHFVEMLSSSLPFYSLRHCVKPGLTGWAQINYGYAASVDESAQKLSYDLFYVRHCSIFLDLIIIAQTIGVVLWKRGHR